MLGRIARFIFALAALSPVALVWAIASSRRSGFNLDQAVVLASGVVLAIVCYFVLQVATKRLSRISFAVQEVRAADNEVVAFVVAYLLPLILPAQSFDVFTFALVLLILAAVLSAAHAFTFNPLLTLFGYHFYEVKASTGVFYLLLSKNDVTDVKQVVAVGKLTNNMILDLS